jgi:toxoflavin biosynthesis protein ToxD
MTRAARKWKGRNKLNLPERIVRGEINELPPRAAMGLPKTYTSPTCETLRLDEDIDLNAPASSLVRAFETEASLERRLQFGMLLALKGDPRIRTFEPQMVDVPGGMATLGTQQHRVDALFARYETYGVHRNWFEKECPRFETEIAGFRLAVYPVTNSEYLSFLKDASDDGGLPSAWPDGRMPHGRDNHPVYTVSPKDADAYAAWLSRKTGRRFRLPTEYEWEFAAAGPEGFDFPWGDTFSAAACNTLESGILSTSPVGAFPSGRAWCGAHDMAGNVEEIVAGVYHPYPGGEVAEDDLFKLLKWYRIARGGAYNRFQDLARCQRRHGPYPNTLYAMGFRLAEDAS